ncbi:uncharacterized protein BKCO1_5800010 [Diplodia corticola]|uniref:Uncharacterized protein n=1 Tax=Diplodia corticola TaxID=236234 RepID=A0A1J9QRK3_9PEZI|nr:uncharacterized protein BKCO1_5800010 [Diplodia corticola]OJD30642.1 hypothetical protein BKCO1_5800010 [Diplodia corticola]
MADPANHHPHVDPNANSPVARLYRLLGGPCLFCSSNVARPRHDVGTPAVRHDPSASTSSTHHTVTGCHLPPATNGPHSTAIDEGSDGEKAEGKGRGGGDDDGDEPVTGRLRGGRSGHETPLDGFPPDSKWLQWMRCSCKHCTIVPFPDRSGEDTGKGKGKGKQPVVEREERLRGGDRPADTDGENSDDGSMGYYGGDGWELEDSDGWELLESDEESVRSDQGQSWSDWSADGCRPFDLQASAFGWDTDAEAEMRGLLEEDGPDEGIWSANHEDMPNQHQHQTPENYELPQEMIHVLHQHSIFKAFKKVLDDLPGRLPTLDELWTEYYWLWPEAWFPCGCLNIQLWGTLARELISRRTRRHRGGVCVTCGRSISTGSSDSNSSGPESHPRGSNEGSGESMSLSGTTVFKNSDSGSGSDWEEYWGNLAGKRLSVHVADEDVREDQRFTRSLERAVAMLTRGGGRAHERVPKEQQSDDEEVGPKNDEGCRLRGGAGSSTGGSGTFDSEEAPAVSNENPDEAVEREAAQRADVVNQETREAFDFWLFWFIFGDTGRS